MRGGIDHGPRQVLIAMSRVILVSALLGCSTPQERQAVAGAREAEAKAAFEEQRLQMLKAYHDCLKKEGADGVQRCDHLKAATGN